MTSVLKEILTLRNGYPPLILRTEENPYIVTAEEQNNSKTAYCFSIPVRTDSGKIIQQKWRKSRNGWSYKSIGGNIFIEEDKMRMKNKTGECLFVFPDRCESYNNDKVVRNYSDILPTPNGTCIRTRLGQGREYHLILDSFSEGIKITKNDKYISLIAKSGAPFVVMSGVCTTDSENKVRGAVDLYATKNSDKKIDIRIKPKTPVGTIMYIDIAFYQTTLFQDTTIESLHPKQNNIYGSSANIGLSVPYGEQLLYSKLMPGLIREPLNREILTAIWHIPCHGQPGTDIALVNIEKPFFPEQLKWENKPSFQKNLAKTTLKGNYLNINVTNLIQADFQGVLKAHSTRGFSSISTANCNYAPQVLEINYK